MGQAVCQRRRGLVQPVNARFRERGRGKDLTVPWCRVPPLQFERFGIVPEQANFLSRQSNASRGEYRTKEEGQDDSFLMSCEHTG